jgi:3-deoxy-manno-octulosonate cytidylyltransferase (CMP-KDO synthetase)
LSTKNKRYFVVIPARLDSTRLERKALLPINGHPMVARVWQKAFAANLGDVIVATCGDEIKNAMSPYGAKVVVTDPNLPSGTDRIWSALSSMHLDDSDIIVNLQGDLPDISPSYIQKVVQPLEYSDYFDIATLASPIHDLDSISNPNIVKIAMSEPSNLMSQAFYFSRSPIPHNANQYFHHIGIYAYRYSALKKFVNLPMSYLEKCEKLEQLRALEAGLKFGVYVVDETPQSVDTYADIEIVRKNWKHND